MINVTMAITRAVMISVPGPLPLANSLRKNRVNKGPNRNTMTRLMRNIHSQKISKAIHSGITASTNPLSHGYDLP